MSDRELRAIDLEAVDPAERTTYQVDTLCDNCGQTSSTPVAKGTKAPFKQALKGCLCINCGCETLQRRGEPVADAKPVVTGTPPATQGPNTWRQSDVLRASEEAAARRPPANPSPLFNGPVSRERYSRDEPPTAPPLRNGNAGPEARPSSTWIADETRRMQLELLRIQNERIAMVPADQWLTGSLGIPWGPTAVIVPANTDNQPVQTEPVAAQPRPMTVYGAVTPRTGDDNLRTLQAMRTAGHGVDYLAAARAIAEEKAAE